MVFDKRLALIVSGAALVVGIVVASTFIFLRNQSSHQIYCTMEARVCPDGSAVGRQGPKCEFAPCPTVKPGAALPNSSPIFIL